MIGVIRAILEILKAAFGYAKKVEKTKLEKEAVDRRTSKRDRLRRWLLAPNKTGQHEEAGGGESKRIP